MKHLCALILSIALLTFAHSSEIQQKTLDFALPDGKEMHLQYPESMSVKKNSPPGDIPPTFKFHSANNTVSLQVTFMPAGIKEITTQKELNELVKNQGELQYEPGSVEKKTVIVELKISNGMGSMAQYTDADLVHVTHPQPGQYKVVAMGVVKYDKSTAFFTLLGDSFDSADYKNGLAVITGGFSTKK